MSARAATKRRYWLFKTEPSSFSFEDLWSAPRRRTVWDGVRNHRARNFLRDEVKPRDGVLVYHSSVEPPGVAGIAVVSRAAEPDATQFDAADEHFDAKSRRDAPTWLAVEIEAVRELARFVPLAELRTQRALARMALLERGQRLSIQPVTPDEWAAVLALGGLDAADF